MWEIYAYQNADSLFGVFNAAAAIHASNDYSAALAAVAVFFDRKMPTNCNGQSLLPPRGKMVACIGMVSPIFQPNWVASDWPTMAPVRVLRIALGRQGSSGLSRLGHWPAVLGMAGFSWFQIVSLSPDDPGVGRPEARGGARELPARGVRRRQQRAPDRRAARAAGTSG